MVADLGLRLAEAGDGERETLRRRIAQELRTDFATVKFGTEFVSVEVRMEGKRTPAGLPALFEDGRPARRWSVTRFVIDEREPDHAGPDVV